jgi:pimeloyl-ACP methyl ester carboxylesterase
MTFAARHPAQVERLALCSSAPPDSAYRQGLEAALAAAQRSPWVEAERRALEASGLRETLLEEYRRRRFALSVAGYFADPRLAYGLTPFHVQARTADIVRASLGDADLGAELAAGLDGRKVLFLHGDRDPLEPSSLRAFAERIGARMELMSGSGHVPYLEAPEPFFAMLRAFLGEPT